MATKNIAITEDAYNLLARHKRLNESFSEVIRAHFTKKKHLLDFAGAWSDIPEKEWKDFENKVKSARTDMNASFAKRIKRLNL
ncbi:TPA: hypothetical protein HA219_03305 [Candidatus Woesearchaeota archaeon]|nr:antitoxin VapB family protein [Candidatus Woesearchaeota archaeon]HIH39720.1 hypothetical protein [Candidatus Woesearchaeota archaeon]